MPVLLRVRRVRLLVFLILVLGFEVVILLPGLFLSGLGLGGLARPFSIWSQCSIFRIWRSWFNRLALEALMELGQCVERGFCLCKAIIDLGKKMWV